MALPFQIPINIPDSINFGEKIDLSPLNGSQSVTPDANVQSNLQALITIAETQISTSLMNRTMDLAKLDNFATTTMDDVVKNYPYVLSVYDAKNRKVLAVYRLPINPQDIQIQNPYAIKTTVTSGGILEEHNGAPIKMISLNGTTGGIINRGTNFQQSRYSGAFAGTVEAVQQLAAAATALSKTNTPKQNTQVAIENTGYYQMHMLEMFVNTYAELKKSANAKHIRLVLSIPKDKVNYLITPQNLVKRRSVASPMEYLYTFQALAWGTVDLEVFSGTTENIVVDKQSGFRSALSSLRQLRNVISATKNVVTAVGGDIQNDIIDPVNSMIYGIKEVVGLPKTVADMTETLRRSSIPNMIQNAESLFKDVGDLGQSIIETLSGMRLENSDYSQNPVNVSFDEQDPKNSKDLTDLINNPKVMDQINISQLELNQQQLDALDELSNASGNLNSNSIMEMIDKLNNLYALVEPAVVDLDPASEEWDLLYAIKNSITSLKPLLATTDLDVSANEQLYGQQDPFLSKTAMQFWQGISDQNGIAFSTPVGKFAVPFPYRSTLEQLAALYLGDPTRWNEIAALNGLQAPYVDEDGFIYKFLTNGSGNQFNVNSEANLYVGQTVYISSNTKKTTKRKIQQIFKISDTDFIVTVDGAADLGNYKLIDEAEMMAYLPNTVNSLSNIYIPSSQFPDPVMNDNSRPVGYLNDTVENIKFSKIDFLLDDKFDLAITQSGFLNLAYGNTNLYQAAKLKLKTPQKSLLLHPDFGAGIDIGESVADLDMNKTMLRMSRSFADDPRFRPPSNIQMAINGSAVSAQLTIPLSNNRGVLPVTLPLSSRS